MCDVCNVTRSTCNGSTTNAVVVVTYTCMYYYGRVLDGISIQKNLHPIAASQTVWNGRGCGCSCVGALITAYISHEPAEDGKNFNF